MKLLSTLAALALAAVTLAQPLPRRPWLGVGSTPVEKGLKLLQVVPGSSADQAGLKVDDVIVSVNGKSIDKPPALTAAFAALQTGTTAKVEYLRDGKQSSVDVKLVSRPVDNGPGYETVYDQVESKGHRIRIFVTKPSSAGKHPVLFIIQGIGYVSNEQPLSSPGGYGRICKTFSDKGYVTVRVEKPGLGDSEGGPADKVDFDTELDSFRQALLKTKTYEFVDPDKIVIFGHSMGGCEGPILASEIPIKGLAVYGTVIRSWHEYMVDSTRSQAALLGTRASELDGSARDIVAALHLLFNENLSPEEAKTKYPKYAKAITDMVPDGEHFSGIGMPFWRGCFAQNYASFWEKLDTNVLSVYGACDFVAERIDHPMIADVVNSVHPGKAKFVEIPNSDHGFRNVASLKESAETWGKPGKQFNPAICDVLLDWAESIVK